jgi:NADH-quinone oxidoreductase subunit F
MTEVDLSPLTQVLEEYTPQGQTALLPALHAAQAIYGYIPEAAAAQIAHELKVPLADVFGVIDFYTLLYSGPVGKTVVHVCNDPACALAGSDAVLKQMAAQVDVQPKPGSLPNLTVERSPCLGLCENAPALLVQGQPVVRANTKPWQDLVSGNGHRPPTILGGDLSLLTANCGKGHTTSLTEYRQKDGYLALQKALLMSPAAVIDEIKKSGLVGRGGAAFPTGIKWEGAANAAGDVKYVICNGDEAEPGTFKDRVILQDDPHSILEGLIIAAYATGAHKGYIYIRGEYQVQFQTMLHAVKEARADGKLGDNILSTGFSFDVEVRLGAGAYICGEETALFESIEGKRGFPRIKPPYPTTYGLFGKPTVINNVETLINVPLIIRLGAEAYRNIGTEKSPGPKLFCVSGDVVRPGLYEVPFGTSLRHVLFDLAGGIRSGHTLQAALFGGAAGAFATEKDLDVSLSFEDLRAVGLPLGSGVITVFDETRDLRDVLLRLAYFFKDESCGKCYPCQLGTQRQYEIMERIAVGKPLPGDLERLQDVGWTMTDASLCGLGQTAASAVLSAAKNWPGLFQDSRK